MLQNAYLLAKIGADTAKNEQHFAEILLKIGNYPTGPPGRGLRVSRGTWSRHRTLCWYLVKNRLFPRVLFGKRQRRGHEASLFGIGNELFNPQFLITKTRCLDENEEKHGKKENPERKKKIKERPLRHL